MSLNTKQLRVIIADDEAPARRLLTNLLAEDPDIQIAAECANGQETVSAIRSHQPDIVFLDIEMPELDGFDVIRSVGISHMPMTVFVTAFNEFAIRAFEVHAVDYLLKPFTRERFTEALRHAKELARARLGSQYRPRLRTLLREWQYHSNAVAGINTPDAAPRLQRIMVRDRDRIRNIELPDVIWLEAADHYVMVHARGGNHLLYEAMSSLERTLPQALFVRIHRGAIVNVSHVTKIAPARFGAYQVVMSTGEKLQLSRSRRETLQALLTTRA